MSRATRIYYKLLSQEGIKLAKIESKQPTGDLKNPTGEIMSPELQSLFNSMTLVCEDIKDFLAENEIDRSMPSQEIDDNISKIESMRSSYRSLYVRVPNEAMDKSIIAVYEAIKSDIREYINHARATKREQREFKENKS